MTIEGPALVVAPHPDDEVLGVGGTMAMLAARGEDVHVVIMTKGAPPLFSEELVETVRHEAQAAHRVLGLAPTRFLELPAAAVDTIPHHEVNAQLQAVFRQVRPRTVFVPFNGDIHLDHQRIFSSAMVCGRPGTDESPKAIFAYETLSETNWNAPYLTPGFLPNTFVDISHHLELKISAMSAYSSQLKSFPQERSIESLRALAMLRGSTIGCPAAEAFVLVRQVHLQAEPGEGSRNGTGSRFDLQPDTAA